MASCSWGKVTNKGMTIVSNNNREASLQTHAINTAAPISLALYVKEEGWWCNLLRETQKLIILPRSAAWETFFSRVANIRLRRLNNSRISCKLSISLTLEPCRCSVKRVTYQKSEILFRRILLQRPQGIWEPFLAKRKWFHKLNKVSNSAPQGRGLLVAMISFAFNLGSRKLQVGNSLKLPVGPSMRWRACRQPLKTMAVWEYPKQWIASSNSLKDSSFQLLCLQQCVVVMRKERTLSTEAHSSLKNPGIR